MNVKNLTLAQFKGRSQGAFLQDGAAIALFKVPFSKGGANMSKSLKTQASELSSFLTTLSNFALSRPGWLLFLTTLHGCGVSVPVAQKEVPAAELNQYLLTQIQPSDVALFDKSFEGICKSFFSYDDYGRAMTAATFYTSVSTADSGRQSFKDYYEESLGFLSIGIFSLSYEDNDTYDCNFDREGDKSRPNEEKTIFRTDDQVACTLKIHRKILTSPEKFPKLRQLAAGDARANGDARKLTVRQKLSAYWSVLQASGSGPDRFLAAQKKYMPMGCLDK